MLLHVKVGSPQQGWVSGAAAEHCRLHHAVRVGDERLRQDGVASLVELACVPRRDVLEQRLGQPRLEPALEFGARVLLRNPHELLGFKVLKVDLVLEQRPQRRAARRAGGGVGPYELRGRGARPGDGHDDGVVRHRLEELTQLEHLWRRQQCADVPVDRQKEETARPRLEQGFDCRVAD